MPRDESCANYKVCLAGYGPDEIDYACEHCDLLDRLGLGDPAVENITPAPPVESPDVSTVLRALESPEVRTAIIGIIMDDLKNNRAIAHAVKILSLNTTRLALCKE